MEASPDEKTFRHAGDAWALAAILVFIALLCTPFLSHPTYLYDEHDYFQQFSYNAFNRRAILEEGSLPLWAPAFGGGYPFIGHPENMVLSPFFLPVLLFGEVVGVKLTACLMYLVGALGMYYLCRRPLSLSPAPSLAAALLYSLNAHVPYGLHTGNLNVAYELCLPWTLSLLLEASQSDRPHASRRLRVILAALVLAVALATGLGILILTQGLFLLLLGLLFASRKGKGPRTAFPKALLLCVVWTAALGAVRVLPIADLLSDNPRRFGPYEHAATGSLSWENLYHALLDPDPFRKPADKFPDGSPADGVLYVGWLGIVLFLIGVARKARAHWPFLAAGAVMLLLCLGPNAPVDLFALLYRLPLFGAFHMPGKYFASPVAFTLALFGGLSLAGWKGNILKTLLAASALGAALLMLRTAVSYHENLFTEPPPESRRSAPSFHHVLTYESAPGEEGPPSGQVSSIRGGRGSRAQYELALAGLGRINWYGVIELPENAAPAELWDLRTGKRWPNPAYRGEVFFLEKENRAAPRSFASNRIEVEADLVRPGVLVVNQNAYRHWRASTGTIVRDLPLLATRLTRLGRYRVIFEYRPWPFYLGLFISLASLLGAAAWVRGKGIAFSRKGRSNRASCKKAKRR